MFCRCFRNFVSGYQVCGDLDPWGEVGGYSLWRFSIGFIVCQYLQVWSLVLLNGCNLGREGWRIGEKMWVSLFYLDLVWVAGIVFGLQYAAERVLLDDVEFLCIGLIA